MLVHLATIDPEALAELDIGLLDDFLEQGLTLKQRQPPEVVTPGAAAIIAASRLKRVSRQTKNPAISCGAWFIVKVLIQSIKCAADSLTIPWLNGDFETI